MKEKRKISFCVALSLLFAFVIWTALVCTVDIQPIGPQGSSVGFARLNSFVHGLTGVNMLLYTITDWLGLLPLAVALGFAVLGSVQLIKRKSILAVDKSLLLLGGFYLAVFAVYLFFELLVVNYRPILIDGYLEASYPSSTTVLVLCVMPTAIMQLKSFVRNQTMRKIVIFATCAFVAFMVVGRLVSGVHWITDIIGGVLLSAGLVTLYYSIAYVE